MKPYLSLLLLSTACFALAQFSPDNLVVSVVGDGQPVGVGTNAKATLVELTPEGVETGYQIPLTDLNGRNLSADFDDKTTCQLARSPDGKYLTLGGYDLPPNAIGFNRILTPRVVARLDAAGNVLLSSSFVPTNSMQTGIGGAIRSAFTMDGESYVVSGAQLGLLKSSFSGLPAQFFGGLQTTGIGAITSSPTQHRVFGIFAPNGGDFFNWNGSTETYGGFYPFQLGCYEPTDMIIERRFETHAITFGMLWSSSLPQIGLMRVWNSLGMIGGTIIAGTGIQDFTKHANSRLFAIPNDGSVILKSNSAGNGWTVLKTAAPNTRFSGIECVPSSGYFVKATIVFDFLALVRPNPIEISWRDSSNVEVTKTKLYEVEYGFYYGEIPGNIPSQFRISVKEEPWLRVTFPIASEPPFQLGDINCSRMVPTGDADGDNEVTNSDYAIWAAHNGTTVTSLSNGDFDGDGEVTNSDYALWAYYNGVAGDE